MHPQPCQQPHATFGDCYREGCGQPACAHEDAQPHGMNACESFMFEDLTTAAEFQGGGGGYGGGGATGSW